MTSLQLFVNVNDISFNDKISQIIDLGGNIMLFADDEVFKKILDNNDLLLKLYNSITSSHCDLIQSDTQKLLYTAMINKMVSNNIFSVETFDEKKMNVIDKTLLTIETIIKKYKYCPSHFTFNDYYYHDAVHIYIEKYIDDIPKMNEVFKRIYAIVHNSNDFLGHICDDLEQCDMNVMNKFMTLSNNSFNQYMSQYGRDSIWHVLSLTLCVESSDDMNVLTQNVGDNMIEYLNFINNFTTMINKKMLIKFCNKIELLNQIKTKLFVDMKYTIQIYIDDIFDIDPSEYSEKAMKKIIENSCIIIGMIISHMNVNEHAKMNDVVKASIKKTIETYPQYVGLTCDIKTMMIYLSKFDDVKYGPLIKNIVDIVDLNSFDKKIINIDELTDTLKCKNIIDFMNLIFCDVINDDNRKNIIESYYKSYNIVTGDIKRFMNINDEILVSFFKYCPDMLEKIIYHLINYRLSCDNTKRIRLEKIDIIENVKMVKDILGNSFKNNKYECNVCFNNTISYIFGCGHGLCESCLSEVNKQRQLNNKCPFCLKNSTPIKIYN